LRHKFYIFLARGASGLLYYSAHTLGVRLLSVALSAALGILTAHMLGAAGRGVYMLPMVDAALGGAMLGGLNAATSYYMLNERSGAGVLAPALWTAAVFVSIATLAVVVLSAVQHALWSAIPAAISLIPTALIAIATGYYYGTHRVIDANRVGSILTPTTALVSMSVGLFLIGANAGVAIAMWVIANFIAAALAFAMIWTDARKLPRAHTAFMPYFRFAVKLGATQVLTLLNFRVDAYIVSVLTGPATLGIYTVAISAAEAMKINTMTLSRASAPRVASATTTESARLTALYSRANVVVAAISAIAIILVAPWALRFLYGSTFVEGTLPLRILAVGMLAMAPAELLSNFYTLRLGKPMVSFWNAGLSGSICAALSLALIPSFGMNGAAAASTAGYAAGMLSMLRLFARDTGLSARSLLVFTREDARRAREAVRAALRPATQTSN
jgi:O-antigen/teichoic acid export membrane protein